MKPKILTLPFNDCSISPKEPGLRHVLSRIEDIKTSDFIAFDWGYANFEQGKWEILTVENRIAKVVKWAEVPDPQLIL
jgi:hypothetical protein